MSLPRIFVSIASYRDTEAPPTITDLFAKAAHPARVFAGVLWQVVPGDDDDCVGGVAPPGQVRSLTVHASQSMGPCWARHRILAELRGDEDYVLQIDSHSRFAPGWDDALLAMLRSCPSPRPVLSSYPISYLPPDRLGTRHIPVQVARHFNDNGVLSLHSRTLPYEQRPPCPQPSAFVGAGCIFAPAAAFDDVPYDPLLYFQGEEITLAARLWTHGWDLFTPNDVLIYHDYTNDRGRPRHWSDNRDWPTLNARSFARVRYLLAREAAADPEAVRDVERHGLGQVRTLEEYERFADVDFRRRSIGPRAADGRFPLPSSGAVLQRERVFSGLFSGRGWGTAETRSGPGSTLGATQAMRKSLSRLFERLRIRSLLDAGCGDLNWIASCLEGLDLYLGIDVSQAVIDYNVQLHARRPRVFFNVGDAVCDVLPQVDAVLCRHVLTHLPSADIHAALASIRRSGARYLLATSHPGASNTDVAPGGWRPLDLCAVPFSLPAPAFVLQDGAGVELRVWDMRAA
jgi:SAM-dependent methyltransferase